ncbi:MAG: DNA polymerase III subunit delta' [Pseudomonadota bacterium]
MSEAAPEPDCAPGAPHPRHTAQVFGQENAEASFLQAFQSGRLHHGWLLAGPRGVGKATLAWRLARFLITAPLAETDGLFGAPPPPQTLDPPTDHPALARIAALSEPNLCLVRRGWDEKGARLRKEITVGEMRRLKGYFELASTDGGRRVAIIDAADEMNRNAANAMLKVLEEPPKHTILLLVAHQPARLLPTIRSRCRMLRCQTLSAVDLAAALSQAGADPGEDAAALNALSGGSVGTALRLMREGGLALYAQIAGLLVDPDARAEALALADSAAGPKNAARYDLILDLIDLFLARVARAGAAGPPVEEAYRGEAALLSRLAPSAEAARGWADLAQTLSARARHGQAVNIDPAAIILDLTLSTQAMATQTRIAAPV